MKVPFGVRVGTYGPESVSGLSKLMSDLGQEIRLWGVFWGQRGIFVIVRRRASKEDATP